MLLVVIPISLYSDMIICLAWEVPIPYPQSQLFSLFKKLCEPFLDHFNLAAYETHLLTSKKPLHLVSQTSIAFVQIQLIELLFDPQ